MLVSGRRETTVRKPKQRRAKATVAVILQAAARILVERGWTGFNTNVIAQRAGVSIGSLYEYFPNKQALIDAIAEAHLAKGEAIMLKASTGLVSTPPPAEIVEILVKNVVALHEDDPKLHRALAYEVPVSPAIRMRADALRSAAIAGLATALQNHVRDSHVAAQLVFDVTDTTVHRWFTEDDGTLATPERLVEQLERMLRTYLDEMAITR